MRIFLQLLLYLFGSIAYGQENDFDVKMISKNRIKKIEKWVEVKDSIGNDISWAPYIYEFNRKGLLSKYTCYLCTFNSHSSNIQINYFKYDKQNRLIEKIIDKKTSHFYTYPEKSKRLEMGYLKEPAITLEKSKSLYYKRESDLDSNGREIIVTEIYLLSNQKNKYEYSYNSNGDLINRSFYFKMGNPEINKYQYDYDVNLLKSKEYLVYENGERKLSKQFIYNSQHELIKETMFTLRPEGVIYTYKYYQK